MTITVLLVTVMTGQNHTVGAHQVHRFANFDLILGPRLRGDERENAEA
jgi:hypothetical protein